MALFVLRKRHREFSARGKRLFLPSEISDAKFGRGILSREFPAALPGKKSGAGFSRRDFWHGKMEPEIPGDIFRHNKSRRKFLPRFLARKTPAGISRRDSLTPEVGPGVHGAIFDGPN